MRLFDHLASGRPILATDACPQVTTLQPWVQVAGEQQAFLEMLAGLLKQGAMSRSTEMVDHARQHTWTARAGLIHEQIFGGTSALQPGSRR